MSRHHRVDAALAGDARQRAERIEAVSQGIEKGALRELRSLGRGNEHVDEPHAQHRDASGDECGGNGGTDRAKPKATSHSCTKGACDKGGGHDHSQHQERAGHVAAAAGGQLDEDFGARLGPHEVPHLQRDFLVTDPDPNIAEDRVTEASRQDDGVER